MNMKQVLHPNWSRFLVAIVILMTLLAPALRGGQEPRRGFGIVPIKGRPRNRTRNPHLNYYGGRVISTVKVVMVRYGTGTYVDNIAGTATPTMEMFYQQVVNNSYLDWLCEYQTNIKDINGNQGTNQVIGRGSFLINAQITPDDARNGTTITDQNIRDELTAQFDADNLPKPDANTVYMIHFPQGKTVRSGADISCQAFCAYHWNFDYRGQQAYYGVHPDLATGGCQDVCGDDGVFKNQTAVASHELVEMITDPEPRSGWDDPDNDEIGDICAHQHATIKGGDGRSYVVQKQWSNVANSCVVTRDPACDIYVDGKFGSDADPGTPSKPFRTIRGAYNALPSLSARTIHIRPGNYPEQPHPVLLLKSVIFVTWGDGYINIGTP